jgi:DNA-binding transcriptional LysR family regulator
MQTPINERRVAYFYEATSLGSLRAAADKLDMNASVISRQIAQLEAELAIPLMERHGRGVKPTEAGQLLIEFFRQQTAQQGDLIAKLDEIRGLARGHIDVVLGEGFVSELLAEPLSEFWRRYPALTVSLNLAGTNEVTRRVQEDAAHIGLVYNLPRTPGIQSRAAVRHPLCAIVNPNHPLARQQRRPMLADLRDYPVAQMYGAYGVRQLIEAAEHADGLRLSPTLTTNSMLILKHFVAAGSGVMMLPAFAMSREIDAGQLVAIPIDHPVLARAQAQIITRAGRQLSGAANKLLLLLTSTMRTFREAQPRKPR